MLDGAVNRALTRSNTNIRSRRKNIANRRLRIVGPEIPSGLNQLLRLQQITLGVQLRVDQLFKTSSDLKQHAFPQLPGVLKNPWQLPLRLRHKVIKRPDDVGIEVPDQHLNQ